jgi:2-dehydro-3-deoxyphosphogalactonate aldolase
MKITAVEGVTVKVPPPSWGGQEWYFLKITTDEGIHGWGEMAYLNANRGKSRSLNHEVAEIGEAFLVGEDPLRRERHWKRIYDRLLCHHADLIRMGILSGIDVALWDIAGKVYGVPIYELLGGVYRDRIRTYSYIYDVPERGGHYYERAGDLWMDSEATAERAAAMAEEGFTGLKLDPILQRSEWGEPAAPYQLSLEALDRAERTIRLIREAVGSRCDILIGTHGQMTAAAAIRLARRLEPYDPLWFEEPVPPENAEEMAKVARATSIPVATGERLATVYDFVRLFEAGAVAIAQPDMCCCGGISEFRKIAGMAEAHYVQMAPHCWGGPILTASSVQMDVCTPNFLIQESIYLSRGFFDELLVEPMSWEAGDLIPPKGPGLGVDLDEKALKKHAVG